ncbi:autotransporter assembly complex protein TamA [Glaciecola sp. XM2]|uniref:autotransporter assembly complex protein TamA n=1 Tax=Glaciecola sp. XM2 TaxID=1914931 RepID=UPI001BDEB625|nr:autotransporter assembly complex family protein [Glaciecola sp. XM2]MBT1450289.1 autotransporter assembly complex protein TamA [Glaciecola sp. XM2]
MAQTNITINGIDDSALENNIRLLLAEVEPPVGKINQEKYIQSLTKEAQKAVQGFGYYDANIAISELTFAPNSAQPSGRSPNISYQITFDLGSQAKINRVVLVNDLQQINQQAIPKSIHELIAQVRQLEGQRIDHGRYESLKNRLKTLSLIHGYFDFNFVLHKLIVQPNSKNDLSDATPTSTATVHWIFYLGSRYKFGDLTYLRETRGQEIARNVMPFKKGEYFDQSKVGDFSIDMQATGYFSSAIARANAQEAVNYEVPIEVILDPKPKDTFEYGVGVSTDTGPRFTVDWSRPWVNLDGHSLGARLYLSNPRKSLQLNYRVPKANPLNDFMSYQIGFRQTDENQTVSDTFSLAAQRQWGATDEEDWTRIGFIKYEQESFTQGSAEPETTRLLLPGFTYTRTRKQGDIFVSWGDLQQVTVEGGNRSLMSDIDFFKVTARTKWIRELGKHRFILRADAGAIATNDFSQVPSTQRFFAGGDQSIRGFGLNEISDFETTQVDDEVETELLGGKYLAVASVEYAYPVAEDWRMAAFLDVGNASDKPFENPAFGYGLGVHWLSPIGTVRVYLARGESEQEEKPKYRIHLVIGPGL